MLMRRRSLFSLLFLIFSIAICFAVPAQDKVISEIDIEGNQKVSNATITSKIKIRPTQAFNESIINDDIKNLYATGFFETVEVDTEETPDGIKVIFILREKPILKTIDVKGSRYIRADKILKTIDIKEGSFVDDYVLRENTRKIKDLYVKKGFSQAEIDYDLMVFEDTNQAEVTFIIDEKRVVKVRDVFVEGNKSIPTKSIIKVMKTRRAWLFNPGLLKDEVLQDDILRITDFYKREGFTDVNVEIDVEYITHGAYVLVKVYEGKRYYIGKVTIEGNKNVDTDVIESAMKYGEGDLFSDYALYVDSSNIRQVYVDRGYIFAQAQPLSHVDPETQRVTVTYKIAEHDVAYVEKIEIRGNTKTKDKVIRRELRIYPGERFDGKKVRKSKEKLEDTGFFEEIRFGTEPGTEPNWVDLVLDVKEAKTGYISFGGGYSSIEDFIGFVELRQRNFDFSNWSTFTGGGQDLSVRASFGTLTSRYEISFTNPWIFDRPISFGFDAYNKGHRRDEGVGYAYEQEVTGGLLRLGRQFNDHLGAGVGYRFDRVRISDVVDNATQDLKDEEGTTNLSSLETSLTYNSTDSSFSPSKGIIFYNSFQVTTTALGGDKDFTKYFGRFSKYFPLFKKSVLEFRLRAGLSDPFGDTAKVPIYERFFAGGGTTIRGYQERKVGPIDAITDDPLGGEAMFISNVEYTYPIIDFLKVAAFFDSGNVWRYNKDFMSGSLKSSIGMGLRVKTPIGPVSVDYGWPLDTEPGEDKKEGRFHFSVSRGF